METGENSALSRRDEKAINGNGGAVEISKSAAGDVVSTAAPRRRSKGSNAGVEKDAGLVNGDEDKASAEEEAKKPKPSKLKATWEKLGLDAGTLAMMFK
jgi:hypothetical protein